MFPRHWMPILSLSLAGLGFAFPSYPIETTNAIVVLRGQDSSVFGTVRFTQEGRRGRVVITGKVKGLEPNSKHGMHVHSFGNLSDGCDSSGTHFNPDDATHGAPNALVRHVGDLGNIEADDEGVAKLSLTDYEISLRGYKSIIGRTLIIHGGEDDLGLGGTPMSPINGNSGAKVACGIIGFADADESEKVV